MDNSFEYLVCTWCFTYNQASYIQETLKGFLIQKTDFPVVNVIIDDASSDGEQDLLRRWAEENLMLGNLHDVGSIQAYGDLLWGESRANKNTFYAIILLRENLYQCGRNKEKFKIMSRWTENSKYLAVCEGDDYWIDPLKLNKQVEVLETHPEIDMCSTAAIVIQDNVRIGKMAPVKYEGIIPGEEVIAGGGGFFSTNTLRYRSSLLTADISCSKYIMLDYFLQIDGALRGGIYYLVDETAAYRRLAKNSWTSRMGRDNRKSYYHKRNVISTLFQFNQDTHGSYSEVIYDVIDSDIFFMLEKGVLGGCFKKQISQMNLKRKIKYSFSILKGILFS